ncbi:MAG: hypothetical protein KC619_10300 [Myxococcales bacterium]|nr:hypothetical protein [Myxococcales bacterium]
MKRLALLLLVLVSWLPVAASAQRRVVVPVPPGRPQVSAVRAEIRQLGPAVQQCVDLAGAWPNAGPRPRLRLRVWLEPDGRYQLEVPELGPSYAALPMPAHMRVARLRACLNAQVARRIRRFLRPFRGRRQKIERAFRVQLQGVPPSAAELARQVTARRTELLACIPGAGRGEREELVIRATLGVDGVVRLTGLAVPASVPFEAAARCVAAEVEEVSVGRVTEERRFEAVLPYRFTPVAVAGPE